MLYRVLKTISGKTTIQRGDFIQSSRFSPDALNKLLEVGALSELHAPPLQALPDFQEEAAALERVGITQADDLLERDIDKTASELGVTPQQLRGWCMIVSNWLLAPETHRRRG